MIIAFEGIHNSGKSTLIKLFKRNLENKGEKVYVTEWNSHILVSSIYYKMKDANKLNNPYLFYYMQIMDFVYRHDIEIKRKQKEGYIILADRYIYTARVRGNIRGIDDNIINTMCSWIEKPDVSVLIDLSVEESIKRGKPQSNDIWQAGLGINKYDNVFDIEGYKTYLCKQRECYLKQINYEKDIILYGEDDLKNNLSILIEKMQKYFSK